MDTNIENALIKKEIISAGTKYIELTVGTRVLFHYQTRKCDENHTVIDDSRVLNKPMELVLGKKFKLEVWEVIVQKMALNEIAKFTVDKSLVAQYPFISKTLRDCGKKNSDRRHCCGMTLQNEGIGYKDLDDLFMNPVNLEFIIELISVELPSQYEKERWQMTDEEKIEALTSLREKGKEFYKKKDIINAEECYKKALGIVEHMMLMEKPHDVEWCQLAQIKVVYLLNFAQCRLLSRDYYTVIEQCNEAIKLDRDNVKAYYRRAKGHLGAWNLDEAILDFKKCAELDKSMTAVVAKELQNLDKEKRTHDIEDKLKYKKMF